MKLKTIAIIFLFFFLGCEKEQCELCTTVMTCTGGYKTTVTFEACGKDLKDVDGKVYTSSATVGGVTATCISRTNCK
jgi:hypothetical protein